MNDFQKTALKQLEEISICSDNQLEIINISEKSDILLITISILCKYITTNKDGIQFNERERFEIFIPPDFPFDYPAVVTPHIRFMGKPHVQFGNQICLYLSPNTQWNPEQGMFGFITRLYHWLERAGINELDPVEIPLHPPVEYKLNPNLPIIIPTIDTPKFKSSYWLGYARLEKLNEKAILITEWLDASFTGKRQMVAPVILLSEPMPFEFPIIFDIILRYLDNRGVNISEYLSLVQGASMINGSGKDMYIVLGTPMRGFADDKKQHLSIWHLGEPECRNLRTFDKKKHREKLIEWSIKPNIDWCEVRELRGEVLQNRDIGAPINWFRDKTVAIWGCGALGSHIAEHLTRAGVKKLILYDNGKITPGILARQNFDESKVGYYKTHALSEYLKTIRSRINPIEITTYESNILHSPLNKDNIFEDEDIIIDTTASNRVLVKLEFKLKNSNKKLPIVSMAVGHQAMNGFVVLSNTDTTGGALRIIRKAKIDICRDEKFEYFADEFFPDKPRSLFQPEPGCSEPTFTGSNADTSSLASAMLNLVANDLEIKKSSESSAHFIRQYFKSSQKIEPLGKSIHCNNGDDKSFNGKLMDYEVIMKNTAYQEIIKIIKKSPRKLCKLCETGGLLFGDWDDINKIVYIDVASPPPTDSKFSPTKFICGIKGTKVMNDELKKSSRGSISFVGQWHSHPFSSSEYSGKDKNSMVLIVNELSPPKSLMLIVGYTKESYDFGFYIFHKDQFKLNNE